MQYHYERCTGNAPRFKCQQCSREYESRTGLNYHMTSSHLHEPSEESRVRENIMLSVMDKLVRLSRLSVVVHRKARLCWFIICSIFCC